MNDGVQAFLIIVIYTGILILLAAVFSRDGEGREIEKTVFVEYRNNYCAVDDIGLVRLTVKDIEAVLNGTYTPEAL